jgi:hypothetical protein
VAEVALARPAISLPASWYHEHFTPVDGQDKLLLELVFEPKTN